MDTRLMHFAGMVVVWGVMAHGALDEAQRAALARALEPMHRQYDPVERMIKRPFSSPGYHTTLKGGYVHPTRESLRYAAALMDTGEEHLRQRAMQIMRRVIALQDQDPASRTYGIWSWFLEEPLDKMSPPDWNWADFCGRELLQVALHHRAELPPDLMEQVDAALVHAARSIQRRNVGPGYTNIAILGTYVTLVTAETYGLEDLKAYAMGRLRRLHEYTMQQGGFSEYNSPTYTLVSLKGLAQLRHDAKDPEAAKLVGDLYRMAWEEMALHFHAPTRQWAGPHSRCYGTLLGRGTLALIERATERRVEFGLQEEPVDVESYRVPLPCPRDLEPYFLKLDKPRLLVKRFIQGELPVIGTTYLHPKFALGSINRGDMWNQRRALLAYWGSPEKPSYLHVRFLHDGYDFSAAQFFSTQQDGRVLGGINFAIDGGDRHISLDAIKNGTIRAKDLRLRFELGGEAGNQTPTPPGALGQAVELRWGDVQLRLMVPFAQFGEATGRWEAGRDGDRASVDVVLYEGEERAIRLADLGVAGVGLAVELAAGECSNQRATAKMGDDRLKLTWDGMKLSVPVRPASLRVLQRTVVFE